MNEKEQLKHQFLSLISAFSDPVDGVIYHYTSAEGLRGIIENSEIWLTNTAFVNDTTECRALQEEVSLFTDDNFINENVRDCWKHCLRSSDNSYNNYIASFSKTRASLDQYRAYGNFCLGFDANNLVSPNSNLYQCVYKKEEIKEWILEKEKVKEWEGKNLSNELKQGAAFSLISAASRKYKNDSFSNEEEIRLISVSNHTWGNFPYNSTMFSDEPPIHYRNHLTYKMPIPYVKYFIGSNKEIIWNETYRESKERKLNYEKNTKRNLLPITEILIGPMLHQKEAEIACKILLRDMGYKDVKVDALDIPYRGL